MTKYHNTNTSMAGIVFDSKKEAQRYVELRCLERVGAGRGGGGMNNIRAVSYRCSKGRGGNRMGRRKEGGTISHEEAIQELVAIKNWCADITDNQKRAIFAAIDAIEALDAMEGAHKKNGPIDVKRPDVEGMTENQARHMVLLYGLNEMYAKKNSDYGNSTTQSYKEFGLLSYIVRITDKLNRIKALATGKAQNVVGESIQDSFLDMANYSVMAVMDMQDEERGR